MKFSKGPLFGFASFLFLASNASAQAVPAGVYKSHIQAGAGAMYLNNDYNDTPNKGVYAWLDYDFSRLIGVEVEARFGGIITPGDIGENTFLFGPRLMYHRGNFTGYAKLLAGRGYITSQNYDQTSAYNVGPAFGGGLDYRATRRLNIRVVDFELQKWLAFDPHTLTPVAISVGLSYVIR